jgi:hypothetical protein
MAVKNNSGFRVALNPRNPEANSWYDPTTGVNLFLSKPESADLDSFKAEELSAVLRGIRAGLLIISRGNIPEGIELGEVSHFASPRARWADEVKDQVSAAMKNHESAVGKAN